MRIVTITTWDKAGDDPYTHIRDCGKSSATGIKSHDSVVIGEAVEQVIEAGLALRMIVPVKGDSFSMPSGNCLDLEEAIEGVVGYSDKMIADARRQMLDSGFSDEEIQGLTDMQVAAIDWKARQEIIEQARDIGDPWNATKIVLDTDKVIDMAVGYIEEKA